MCKKQHKIFTTAYDKRGVKICSSTNDYKLSHPYQKELSVKAGMSEERIFLHSEVRVLLKSSSMRKKVHTLKVERFDSQGTPKIAFPCASCQLAVKLAGVKKVVFTTEDGYNEWIV